MRNKNSSTPVKTYLRQWTRPRRQEATISLTGTSHVQTPIYGKISGSHRGTNKRLKKRKEIFQSKANVHSMQSGFDVFR